MRRPDIIIEVTGGCVESILVHDRHRIDGKNSLIVKVLNYDCVDLHNPGVVVMDLMQMAGSDEYSQVGNF